MTLQFTYRPLPVWPHPVTPAWERRGRWTFKATYEDTIGLLADELRRIDGSGVVLGVGLRPEDLRKDGTPRAGARPFAHPGVELSFDSKFGRLTYATDAHEMWEHNLRAIALSLQALRAVDRYGVSKRGEQYAGWAQLAPGGPDPARGRELVERAGGLTSALKRHHPDQGGNQRDFVDVMAYRTEAGL